MRFDVVECIMQDARGICEMRYLSFEYVVSGCRGVGLNSSLSIPQNE